MGNLGAGLKTHAGALCNALCCLCTGTKPFAKVSSMFPPFIVTVTMFERGKLSDEFLDSLLEELQLVKPKAEGEAQVCPFQLRGGL